MSEVCDTCGGCESDPCSMDVHEEAAAERETKRIVEWMRAIPHRVIDDWGLNATGNIADMLESGAWEKETFAP